ncbi:DUF6668 family protein [Streptomyces sp. NPDC058001]|uniref:DUF6668 family protein n=1 Tax=Streptomyces sp. NPDC058001 TaxID=3346300 RepID=UPI0036E84E21
MGTPPASGPQSWVRGPKPAQPEPPRQTPPKTRPAADGDAPGPAPNTGAARSRTGAARPRTGAAGPAPSTDAPVRPRPRTSAPATPQPTPVRRATPARRAAPAPAPAPAPASDASWDESKRPKAARKTARKSARTADSGEVGWIKAHGGSGATTLAEALGGVDVGARWPDPRKGEPRRIVLVGRTSADGLRAVSRVLRAFEEGKAPKGLDLLAVVLVADAPGRLPLSLLRRVRVLRSVARVYRVPWIPAWRTGGRPKSPPRRLAMLAELVGGDVYGSGSTS